MQPTQDFSSMGMDEVARFVKQISHFGLSPKEQRRWGQVYFRWMIQCKGPSGKVRCFFAVPDNRWMGFTSALYTAFSGVHFIEVTEDPCSELPLSAYTLGSEGFPAMKGVLSNVPFDWGDQEPLGRILMAMGAGKLTANEETWLELSMAPAGNGQLQRKVHRAEKWLLHPANEPFSFKSMWRELSTDAKSRPKEKVLSDRQQNIMALLESKRSGDEPGLWTSFRMYIHSPSSKARFQTIYVTLKAMKEGGNGLLLRPIKAEKMRTRLQKGVPTRPVLLTSGELAPWLCVPSHGSAVAFLKRTTSKIIAAPEQEKQGLFIGKSNVPGVEKEIRIPLNQMLKHSFLAGTTGSGKTSTLLSIMKRMVEEIQQRPGQAPGFTFLDPHGGAIETLLSYIPRELYPKLHIIPLGHTDRPRGFNLFQTQHKEHAEALTGEFVMTLQQLFPGSRPRAEHYLRSGVLSLLSAPPQTVLGVSHIFMNEYYRKKLLPNLDPHLRHFWETEFKAIKNIGEHLGPILNKLGALTTYPTSRRMLGQLKSSISTRQCMDEGHIVLIDGSGCVSDLLKIISSLFFIDYHFTCRKRPQHQSRPHFFFADEMHLFATDILTKILAEDRKFGLSLFLATQYLSQLPDRILEAILGNVGTLMLLQLGGPDADKLSRWLKPQVSSQDLMNLPELHAIVRTKGSQGNHELFTMKNEIVPVHQPNWIQQAWHYSDKHDGRSIEAVEQEIKTSYGSASPLQSMWKRTDGTKEE